MANVWRRNPSGRLTAYSLIKHANGEATADIASSGFFEYHLLAGEDAAQSNTSTTGQVDLGLLVGNNVAQPNTSTTGATSSGLPHARAEQLAVRVVSQSDPVARAEQIAVRVVSQTDPVARAEQIAVRVVSSVTNLHVLTGNNASQPNTSSSGAISQSHALTGNNASQPNTSSSGAISSSHTLGGQPANQPNFSSSGNVVSIHTLTGNPASQPNTSDSGAISQSHALTGNAVLGYHTSTSGAISQNPSSPSLYPPKVLLVLAQLKTGANFLMTQTHDITMAKGKTFSLQLSYAEDELIYKPITAIPTLAPARLTVTAHGLPSRWPVRTESAVSPTELNMTAPNWRLGTRFDANTVELNDLNLLSAKPFVGPAVLVYQKPADMTGWKMRMQIRDLTTNTVLLDASSDVADAADGTIDIDVPNSAFAVTFSAAQTAAVTWTKAGYDIEAILPDGSVVSLIGPSKITAEKEYTVWP